MSTTNNSPKTIAIAELSGEFGISEADPGGKLKIQGKDPIVVSKHRPGDSTSVPLALLGMKLAAIWK